MFAFAEPVTILTAQTSTDPYSKKQVPDWDKVPSERTEACGVADGGSTSPLAVDRQAVEADFDLLFDHDPGITTANRVRVRGLPCTVEGRPFTWRNPFTGWEAGTVVQVKIVEG